MLHGDWAEAALDVAYFIGCAMWTAFTAPFLMNELGFVTDELDPWHEDGETWRRLHCVFPKRVACQNRNQVFYFGPDGLPRRHDYNLDVVGGGIARVTRAEIPKRVR